MDFFLSVKIEPEQMLNLTSTDYPLGSCELFVGKYYDGPKENKWTSKEPYISC